MITKFWESGLGQLIIVWTLAVVAFFALWSVLAKVVQRISKKKHDPTQTNETVQEDTDAISPKA